MARINTNAEVWAGVTEFGAIRDVDAGASTTLSAAAAAGVKVLPVSDDLTGTLQAGDYVRVGRDNLLEVHVVDSLTVTDITLETELVRDHDAAEPVVEQELVNWGAVADDGVNVDHSGTQTEINAVTQADAYVTLLQNVLATISCNLLNYSPENIAATLGIPESEITGTGAAGDPFQIFQSGDTIATVQNTSLYCRGFRRDNSTYEIIGFDATFDPNQAKNLLRGQQVNLPISADVNGGVVWRMVQA